MRDEVIVTDSMEKSTVAKRKKPLTNRRINSRIGFFLLILVVGMMIVESGLVKVLPDMNGWGNTIALLAGNLFLGGMGLFLFRFVPKVADREVTPNATSDEGTPGSFKPWWLIPIVFILYFLMMAGANISTSLNNLLASVFGQTSGALVNNALGGMSSFQLILSAVILGPIAEELVFRYLLIPRLEHYGEKAAVFFSAFLFAIYHQNFEQEVYAFFIGLVLGWVFLKSRKIQYTIILHAIVNFLGSVAPFWVVENSRYEEWATPLGTGELTAIEAVEKYAGEMALYGGYLFMMCVMMLAGLILMIVFLAQKKFTFVPVANAEGKKKTAGELFGNPGTILMMIYCALVGVYMFLIQVFVFGG